MLPGFEWLPKDRFLAGDFAGDGVLEVGVLDCVNGNVPWLLFGDAFCRLGVDFATDRGVDSLLGDGVLLPLLDVDELFIWGSTLRRASLSREGERLGL